MRGQGIGRRRRRALRCGELGRYLTLWGLGSIAKRLDWRGADRRGGMRAKPSKAWGWPSSDELMGMPGEALGVIDRLRLERIVGRGWLTL